MIYRRTNIFAGFLMLIVASVPLSSQAGQISSTDLWDLSGGSVVGNNSGALNYHSGWRSDIRSMFAGYVTKYGGGPLYNYETLFKDYINPGYQGGSVPAGFTHFVEWNTSSLVTLRSFALHAYNEGMHRRAFNRFSLFISDGVGGWTSIFDTGPGYTYPSGLHEIAADIAAVSAQHFRAEFVQAPWCISGVGCDSRAIGPRVLELDGFDTFLDGSTGDVPEPATLALMGLGLAGIGWKRRKDA